MYMEYLKLRAMISNVIGEWGVTSKELTVSEKSINFTLVNSTYIELGMTSSLGSRLYNETILIEV